MNWYKISNKVFSVAHVGHSGENGCPALTLVDWIDTHIPEMKDIQLKHDYIDLNKGRDFLKEGNTYDFVLLEYVYLGITRNQKEGYFAQSNLQTPENWRKRLQNTNAKVIFAFGSWTEVSGSYIGNIPGYEKRDISSGSIYVKNGFKVL